ARSFVDDSMTARIVGNSYLRWSLSLVRGLRRSGALANPTCGLWPASNLSRVATRHKRECYAAGSHGQLRPSPQRIESDHISASTSGVKFTDATQESGANPSKCGEDFAYDAVKTPSSM